MARSSVSRERVVTSTRYPPWPSAILNWWIILMLGTGGYLLGAFADFISIQQQMRLGIPWLFPFGVVVGSLTVVFIILMIIGIAQKNLPPSAVLLGCFILIVLYITGLVETAIQLFGNGNVNSTCSTYVYNQRATGVSIYTLAWMEQYAICNEWDAAFAFWIVGLVLLIYMMIVAAQVISTTSDLAFTSAVATTSSSRARTRNCNDTTISSSSATDADTVTQSTDSDGTKPPRHHHARHSSVKRNRNPNRNRTPTPLLPAPAAATTTTTTTPTRSTLPIAFPMLPLTPLTMALTPTKNATPMPMSMPAERTEMKTTRMVARSAGRVARPASASASSALVTASKGLGMGKGEADGKGKERERERGKERTRYTDGDDRGAGAGRVSSFEEMFYVSRE